MLTKAWQKFKSTLMQVVVVRRMDESVKPLLSPDQSAYARLNLQLMLEETEMAVLRGNQPLYERALAKAQAAVADWYDSSNPRVDALSNTLGELSKNNVAPDLPDISKSLDLLKERLAGRLNKDDGDKGKKTLKLTEAMIHDRPSSDRSVCPVNWHRAFLGAAIRPGLHSHQPGQLPGRNKFLGGPCTAHSGGRVNCFIH